jgi:hypothetical protein
VRRRDRDLDTGVPARRVVIGLLVAIIGLAMMTGLLPFTNVTVGLLAIVVGLGLMV